MCVCTLCMCVCVHICSHTYIHLYMQTYIQSTQEVIVNMLFKFDPQFLVTKTSFQDTRDELPDVVLNDTCSISLTVLFIFLKTVPPSPIQCTQQNMYCGPAMSQDHGYIFLNCLYFVFILCVHIDNDLLDQGLANCSLWATQPVFVKPMD